MRETFFDSSKVDEVCSFSWVLRYNTLKVLELMLADEMATIIVREFDEARRQMENSVV